MAMRCKICSHPKQKEINKALTVNQSYQMIANNFGVNWQSVRSHAINHLQPIINEANEEAKQIIVNEIVQLRKEVNYPVLMKVKLLQEKILNDLDSSDAEDRPPLFREFRGALQEEAKLGGLYQQDRPNDAENYKRAVQQLVENKTVKSARDGIDLFKEVGYPPPNEAIEQEIIKEHGTIG